MIAPQHPSTTGSLSDVTVVVISYESAAVLPGCLNSIPPGVRLIVLDNASRDGSPDLAARLAPSARVIRAERNLGFGPAANLAFAEAETRFGLLLNADARCHPGMIPALLEAAARYPEAGLLAPASYTLEGRLQHGRRALFSRGASRGDPAAPEGDCCVPFAGGAATFFPMEAFRAIGGFDPAIFLYFEDDDLCLRMRCTGRSLVHVHAARLDHLGGRSSAPSPRQEWWKAWHDGWSRQHIEHKHRGRVAALLRGAARIVQLAGRVATRPGNPRCRRWRAQIAGTAAWLAGRQATAIGMPGEA